MYGMWPWSKIETVVIRRWPCWACAPLGICWKPGRQVVLVEARDRVGGRTYSAPFEAAGLTVDLGAEWVDPDQHQAMMQELARYEIGLEGHSLLRCYRRVWHPRQRLPHGTVSSEPAIV